MAPVVGAWDANDSYVLVVPERLSREEATLGLATPVDLCSTEDHVATCRKKRW